MKKKKKTVGFREKALRLCNNGTFVAVLFRDTRIFSSSYLPSYNFPPNLYHLNFLPSFINVYLFI